MGRDPESIVEAFAQASIESDELSIVKGATRRQHSAQRRKEENVRNLLPVWDQGGHEALLARIEDPHPAVRAAAAVYLLESDPALAMKTLEDVASETKGVRWQTSWTARTCLNEWIAGRLRPIERLRGGE